MIKESILASKAEYISSELQQRCGHVSLAKEKEGWEEYIDHLYDDLVDVCGNDEATGCDCFRNPEQ